MASGDGVRYRGVVRLTDLLTYDFVSGVKATPDSRLLPIEAVSGMDKGIEDASKCSRDLLYL